MITQAERAAEQRRAKLAEVQRQLDEGSLKIRKMTAAERKLYPPRPVSEAGGRPRRSAGRS